VAPSRTRHVTNGPKLKGFLRNVTYLDFPCVEIKGTQGPLIFIKGAFLQGVGAKCRAMLHFCKGVGAKMHP
jgi:hypothetical protein